MKMNMKMNKIKNNIAFCNILIFFVGLVIFKQNIILLQKKEFSKFKLTKLIPKGYKVGTLSYIINNIALNTYKNIAAVLLAEPNLLLPSIILLGNNVVGLLKPAYQVENNYNTFLAFSSDKVLSNGRNLNGQEEYITINKNESEIEVLKLFREKEMLPLASFPSLSKEKNEEAKSSFNHSGKAHKQNESLSSLGLGSLANSLVKEKNMENLSAVSINKDKIEQEWVELKPLLFNYLITKNNQNGIGLDLKNKNFLLSPLLLPTITNSKLTLDKSSIGQGGSNLGNSSYNFNSSSSATNQSIFIGGANSTQETQIVEKKNWYLSEDLIKLISAFFKSIYCLISKPKFINTPDKIIIEILYFITIPDYKIFKWYNFIYLAKSTTTIKKERKAVVASGLGKNIKRRNKSIKLILRKNNLIKKTLFKLNNTNITKLYFNKFIILFKLLSSYFKKPIEFNLIRLHKSNYDSNILAQLFNLILKKKNIRSAIHNLYTKNKFSTSPNSLILSALNQENGEQKGSDRLANSSNFIPAYISGLYIKIGGRLMREAIIPRKTTKTFEKGAIATGKVNFVDTARITKKNKKGAYTIKIAFAQNFMFK
jgi:hypothetical protein